MNSRGFSSKHPAPARRTREEGEFSSIVIAPARARMAQPGDLVRAKPAAPAVQKVPDRKQQSIRDSANGEECTVRIPGICAGGTATTVWSHYPGLDADRGMAMKSLDLCGCYCCAACHDVVDMRASAPEGYPRWQVLLDWFAGHLRSLVRLRQKGIV
jgi:hypothetical protein